MRIYGNQLFFMPEEMFVFFSFIEFSVKHIGLRPSSLWVFTMNQLHNSVSHMI